MSPWCVIRSYDSEVGLLLAAQLGQSLGVDGHIYLTDLKHIYSLAMVRSHLDTHELRLVLPYGIHTEVIASPCR